MSGIAELKQLILLIDEHRQTIGNSQYAFPTDSESRYILQRFSATIPRMRPEAFTRLQELFWKELPWIERFEQIPELVQGYIWSLIYPLRFNAACTKETVQSFISKIEEGFLNELRNIPKPIESRFLQAIGYQEKVAIESETTSLMLFYRQREERQLLESME